MTSAVVFLSTVYLVELGAWAYYSRKEEEERSSGKSRKDELKLLVDEVYKLKEKITRLKEEESQTGKEDELKLLMEELYRLKEKITKLQQPKKN
ncbi:hypothetical protein Pcinc_023668 [Petrolisthes cinctipes]|uniref:Uncharacterized protein n=1 Tax=Petrolisthes cinctipes TaxID=88211 RepID=A0AAE1FD41_PETCI|nr:hypothetical protein Pcinc_023668 [Petrolisthes cinctipes]